MDSDEPSASAVGAAMAATLIAMLPMKRMIMLGLMTSNEAFEMLDGLALTLETQQGESRGHIAAVVRSARFHIASARTDLDDFIHRLSEADS